MIGVQFLLFAGDFLLNPDFQVDRCSRSSPARRPAWDAGVTTCGSRRNTWTARVLSFAWETLHSLQGGSNCMYCWWFKPTWVVNMLYIYPEDLELCIFEVICWCHCFLGDLNMVYSFVKVGLKGDTRIEIIITCHWMMSAESSSRGVLAARRRQTTGSCTARGMCDRLMLPWFFRCKDQTPIPDGSRPPFQTYDPDPLRPQQPWILISFALSI